MSQTHREERRTTNPIPFHPIAALIPEMTEEEYEALRDDIKEHGLREAIVLVDQTSILDGRHRYRACLETGVKPRFTGISGSTAELIAFVVSKNLRRRHLSDRQRTQIALDIANFGHGGNRRAVQVDKSPLETVSRARAAEMLEVNRKAVDRLAKVEAQGAPELVNAVTAGKVSISTAAVLADAPPGEQQEIVARGKKEIIAKAKQLKEENKAARKKQRRNELSLKAQDWTFEPTAESEIKVICDDGRNLLDYVEPGSAQLAIMSPPYNEQMPYDNYSDDLPQDEYRDLLSSLFMRSYAALQEGGRIAVVVPLGVDRNPYRPFAPFVQELLDECGFISRGWIVWDKNNVQNSTAWGSHRSFTNPALRDRVEVILVAHKGSGTLPAPDGKLFKDESGSFSAFLRDPNYFAELTQNYWSIQPETRFHESHPAPFPLLLAQRLIHLLAYPGALVLDPCAGTGTVAVAAKQNGCRAVVLDQSKLYCAMMRERLEKEGSQP